MSSSKKTTDLERLTQPGGNVRPDDETIPVLTERLTLPSLELDISLPQQSPPAVAAAPRKPAIPTAPAPAVSPRAASAPAASPPAAPPPVSAVAVEASAAPSPAPVPELDWTRIEERARATLLRELQPGLTAELDRHLRERLQPTLVRMLLATVTELRPSIEAAVRDAVARAVAAEAARQRSGK